jgi:microcystin-dependent protein
MTVPTTFVPVGTIVAYGGEVKNRDDDFKGQGWLVCDGREVERQHYLELYDSIRAAWGSAREGVFNLPDLRGLFFRVVSGSSNRDPGAAERVALAPGGDNGNLVGSYQKYATGAPKAHFRAKIPNNVIVSRRVDVGCNTSTSGKIGPSDAGGDTVGGGDLETRPKNKYVHYLIKYSNLNKYREEVQLPIGSIIPFAGKPNFLIKKGFIRCDGETLRKTGQFKELFEAIKYAHGDPGDDKFNLPDFRGYFLRGVDTQNAEFRRDPEADSRKAPLPGGNSGDHVGSVQEDATAYPLSKGFFTKIPGLPQSEQHQTIDGLLNYVYTWNPSLVDVNNVTQSGGDAETRPTNISLDWYIKFETA